MDFTLTACQMQPARWYRLACTFVFVVAVGAACATGRSTAVSAEDAALLRRLDERWYRAAIAKDAAAFADFMEEGFIAATGNGVLLDKAAWVEAVRTSTIVYQSGDHHDLQVRRYGNTAVVSGRYSVVAIRAGRPDSARGAFVATWYKRGDRWRVIGAGYSREVAR